MSCFVTTDGDLDVSTGNLQVTQSVALCAAQKLNGRFQLFLGEWFADTREGIPYVPVVFKKNPDLRLIGQMYRTIVLETPGVASIKSMDVNLISRTRELDVDFVAIASDGSEIQGGPGNPFIVTVDKANGGT